VSELVLGTPEQDQTAERPASFAARGRFRIVMLLRAVPIRWRILSIAALNSAVVVWLSAMIWNGAQVLGFGLGRTSGKCASRTRSWRCWKAKPAPAESDPSLHQSTEP